MKRMSMRAFNIYVRTGQIIEEYDGEEIETKFNAWHDPKNGRFTFAGQGRNYGDRAGGNAGRSASPPVRATATRAPAPVRAPKPGSGLSTAPAPTKRPSNAVATDPLARLERSVKPKQPGPNQDSGTPLAKIADAVERMRRKERATPPRLRPISSYSETGTSSWRAANDLAFIEAASRFNSQRGLKPGDPKYVDPLFIKAWAMVESGGSKTAFLRDPLQVNNPGDYNEPKPQVWPRARK